MSHKKRKKGKRIERADKSRAPATIPTIRREEFRDESHRLHNGVAELVREAVELLANMWSPEDIEPMSNEEIFDKLRSIGIESSQEQFLRDTEEYISSEKLAEERWYSQAGDIPGIDGDFPWLAAHILWKRLLTDLPCTETVDSWIEDGYELLDKKDSAGACQLWLRCWSEVRTRFARGLKSCDELNDVLKGMYFASNWTDDLRDELCFAGKTDHELLRQRIRVCRDIVELFPETDEDTLVSFAADEADTYFLLKEWQEGEACYSRLAERFPTNAWVWMRWGDAYGGEHEELTDLDRAKNLYRQALAVSNREDAEVAFDRLESIGRESRTRL